MRAMQLGPEVTQSCTWAEISTKRVEEALPLKDRIKDLFMVSSRGMKAAELDKSDAMAQHLIGAWYFDVAKISWIERNTTMLLFGQAPAVTYQDAKPYLFNSYDLDDTLWMMCFLVSCTFISDGTTSPKSGIITCWIGQWSPRRSADGCLCQFL